MTSEQPGPANSGPRFLLLDDVAAELSTSRAQIYALVRGGALSAVKFGGRGQWRVERARLEEYVAKAYADTEQWVRDNPFGSPDNAPGSTSDTTQPE
jgi:excisionase family DNA binding protein